MASGLSQVREAEGGANLRQMKEEEGAGLTDSLGVGYQEKSAQRPGF